MVVGSAKAAAHGFTSVWVLTIAGHTFPGYTALYALVLNLLVAFALTPLFNWARPIPLDDTGSADYRT
jgi:SSS family solute:Na+ symporter